MDDEAVIAIVDRADPAAAQFGPETVEHRRAANLQYLPPEQRPQPVERKGPGGHGDLHQIVGALGSIGALPIVERHPEGAVIAEQLLLVLGQPVPDRLDRGGGIIGIDPDIALAGNPAVDRIRPVERHPVGRGLQILPAERHLGLAETQAQATLGINEPVDIDVTQLAEILAPLGTGLVIHRRAEIMLEIELQPVGDIALQHQSRPTQQEAAILVDRAVMDRAQA